MANFFLFLLLNPSYWAIYTQSHIHQAPHSMYDIEVYQRALHALVSTINTISITSFFFLLLPSPRYIKIALVSIEFCFLALDYPSYLSIACQKYEIGRLSTLCIFHCHCICISLLWYSQISHLPFHLLSLATFTVSYLLPIDCCTSFTLSLNLHYTILLLAIPLRSCILRAPQPPFATLSPF